MKVKVVILNWNGAGVLSRFLPSVVENTPIEVEIVVADNGSEDGSAELVECDFPTVRVLRLEENYGFAEGYNRALAMLERSGEAVAADERSGRSKRRVGESGKLCGGGSEAADVYVLLNSDVETPSGWLEPLVRVLGERADVAAVAPKLLSVSERDMFEYAGASGGFVDFWGYPFCRGRIMGTVERDAGQYDDAREVFWATGACFVCRASVFRDLGGFDASFFAHQEEIDLCWRMQSAGWKVMVEPHSVVYHLGAGTLAPSPQKLYYNYRNNLLMLYKNLSTGSLLPVLAMRFVLNGLSGLVYLTRGERANFDAVRRAHKDFRAMKREGGDPAKNRAGSGGSRALADSDGSGRTGVLGSSGGLSEKRRQIKAGRIGRPKGIYRGSILLRYIFGRRKFGKLL